jgi:imidazolonepropionase-like amidohydrolase
MRWTLALLALAAATVGEGPQLAAQTLVVEAERIRTGATPGVMGPATIVVEDGRIRSITPGGVEELGDLPPDVEILRAGAVLPGLVDARSSVGLSGLHPTDHEADEATGPVRPGLRALDAYDPSEPLVRQALREGVTVAHVGPGDANSMGGQTALVRTHARTVGEALLRDPVALVISLTEAVKDTYGAEGRMPTTRMGNMALIRQAFLDGARAAEGEGSSRDLDDEALGRVLDGSIPALVVADRRDELAGALRLAREFEFRMWVTGGMEAGVLASSLAGSGTSVVLTHPRERLAGVEDPEAVLGAAARLRDHGVSFVLGSGSQVGGPSLLEWAVTQSRHGLSPDEALAAVTLAPARMLGLADEVGSLERGKVADLVLLDDDPFQGSARIIAVVSAGRLAYSNDR